MAYKLLPRLEGIYGITERRRERRYAQEIQLEQMMTEKIKTWLGRLSFRTGVIVLAMCIPFYILSFAQAALPIDAATKGVLWVVLFGMAKTCQYGGLTILGSEGLKRIKVWWNKSEGNNVEDKEKKEK